MDKYIGRLLDGRYEILEVIGTGGMAVVYKARCHRLNRLVAIKILKDDYMEDEEFRRRFHSESQAVAMLSHPNIVSVYDVSSSITADYIVMELIDGITLKQYMEKKGVLNWKETLHFAIQIGKALEHAHGRGIVHRDIKPHNVMVLKNGSVKVTDFGIARLMSQSNTLTKEALGSVHYISPEQAKGGRVDSRSDIYSLGVVMYEMMSGRPPYDGESPVAVAIKHINGGAVLPSTLNPNIPGGLEQIIMHAMSVDPAQRYPSTTKMLADMDEFRKDPGMLFDYNTPLDDVIRVQRPPLVLKPEKPSTPAPAPVPPVRKRPETSPGQQRRTPGTAPRRPQRRSAEIREEERRNNVATIAIIACSAVMVLAIAIFLIVWLNDGTSSKPELVEVPYLLGRDFEAVKTDTDVPFKLQIDKREYNDEFLEGQIITQNPEAGEMVAPDTLIAVVISLGPAPEEVRMLDISSEWTQEQAEEALDNLGIGLNVKVETAHHETIAAGKVIRTDPVAGTVLTTGQDVTLYVSLGVEYRTDEMPNLVGWKKDAADEKLLDMKLDLNVTYEWIFDPEVSADFVIRTEPEAGEQIATNSEITVYVSSGKVAVPEVLNVPITDAENTLKAAKITNYTVEMVESETAKDTVIELRLNGKTIQPGTEITAKDTLVLVVSKGPTPKTVTVTIELPEDYTEAYTLKVVWPGNEKTVDIQEDYGQATISVELTGTGVQQCEVYVNNDYQYTVEVDFTK